MNKNIPIGFVIHGLNMGGAEKFLIQLTNYLQNSGYKTVLILLSNNKTLLHEVVPGVKIHIIERKYKYDLGISLKLKKIILFEGIKHVLCINSYAFFLSKIAFLFDKSVKFFLSTHSTLPSSFKNYLQNSIYYRLVQRDDTIIYLCQNQKRYLKNTYNLKNRHDFIINNGIDTDHFTPNDFSFSDKQFYKSLLNIENNEKIILQVARLSPEKGHIDAIESLSILHHKFREKAHLFIVGDGDPNYKLTLFSLAKKRGLQKYVHFEGNIFDVRKYYVIADLFTLTSTSTETFSLSALEAMSFGLPCSLTDIGGASEMHVQNLTGILTRPNDLTSIADSWNILLNTKIDKFKIRKHVIDHFDITNMLFNYKNILEEYILKIA